MLFGSHSQAECKLGENERASEASDLFYFKKRPFMTDQKSNFCTKRLNAYFLQQHKLTLSCFFRLASLASDWIWVIFQSCIGLGLAAYKVTISLNALDRWNMSNFGFVTSLLLVALGIAGFVGAVIGWLSLASEGSIPIGDQAINDNVWDDELRKFSGGANFFFAFIALLAFFLNWKLVKHVC